MRRRSAAVLAGMLLLLVSTAGGATAGVPHEADQGGLQPPLNAAFTYRCFERSQGVICQGTLEATWSNEDTGFTCDDQPIYTTGIDHERLSRWHQADGRATRTIVQIHVDETWTLSPTGSGTTVTVRGDWNRHYVYLVPGSIADRVLVEVGAVWNITAPGVGVVAHDAGLVEYAPGTDFDEATSTYGPKDFWTDENAAIASVCAVLAG